MVQNHSSARMPPPTPAKSEIVRSINAAITQRLSTIRALYIVSIATNGPREEISAEFHRAIGDVLEGVPFTKLNLKLINKSKVKDELAWFTSHRSQLSEDNHG